MPDRRAPLITHVEEDLALRVKVAADAAGMSTSSYIRVFLREHVDRPRTRSQDAAALVRRLAAAAWTQPRVGWAGGADPCSARISAAEYAAGLALADELE